MPDGCPGGTISNEKIIDKWASKYGIKINIVQLNDYIESINQYTAGQFDGCTMTNMDALTIPAAGAWIPRRSLPAATPTATTAWC
ncbi:Urea carboxylase-related ABC transporter [Klebsiella michiganensis]|nr:Urea carboxylase-related ABC transporter [Klebsiella michiganensis]